ncbi:MAG: hypothetical protein ACR2QF_03155 [Geminicoccaceae bacterium]
MIVMLIAGAVQAVIVYLAWPWFVQPLGAPALANFWHALGLTFLVGLMASDRLANAIEKQIDAVSGPEKVALAFGWGIALPIAGCFSVVIMWAIASFGGMT